jgi:cytochrome c oxidase subunit 4
MATQPHATTPRYHPEGTPDLPEEHSATQHVSLGTYLAVFVALMVLLAVTVAVAFFVHAGDLNLIIALAIATIKATLVVLYFMHVKYASRLTKIFVCAAFLWLLILFALTFADYLTRDWLPVSKGWVDRESQRPAQLPGPVSHAGE